MSLIIVGLARDRALVGVDTLAGSTSGWAITGEKMLPLPAHRCVLAARGVGQLLPALALVLSFRLLNDFDDVLHLLPEALPDALRALLAEGQHRGNDGALVRQWPHEILAAGWSEREARMLATTYQYDPAADTFAALPVDRWRVHGAEADWPDFPVAAIDTPADLETVARWQVQHWRARQPELRLGGRLLVAELTRDSIRVHEQCDLGVA